VKTVRGGGSRIVMSYDDATGVTWSGNHPGVPKN